MKEQYEDNMHGFIYHNQVQSTVGCMWIRSKCPVMDRELDNISWESDSSRWPSKPFYPMIVATVCVYAPAFGPSLGYLVAAST